jgi:hypothetical protein
VSVTVIDHTEPKLLTDKERFEIVLENLDGWYLMALKEAKLVNTPEEERIFQQDIDTLREIGSRIVWRDEQ